MLLTVESQSHTFLGKRIDNQHYRFTELVYEPDRLYLFDTGKEHTIFNREGIRFMFSVSFPLHQTYRSLMARCRDIGLVS